MRISFPIAAFVALASLASGRQAEPTAVVGVRLVDDAEAPRKTLVLENGRIRALLAEGDEVPVTLRRVDADGLLAVPAFIDAFTLAGCEVPGARPDQDDPPSPESDVLVDMRAANRKGLQPAFRAVDGFALDAKAAESYRAQGFGALHTAPGGHLLGGWSALITTREGALRGRVVAPVVFQSATFAAPGDGYPSTLMGRIAHLRQFFLDARRHQTLLARTARGGLDAHPAYDLELEAAFPLLAGDARLVCFAQRAGDFERWLTLAEELGAPPRFAGGREAWRLAGFLAEVDVPVLLTLEWDEEVPDPDAAPASLEGPSGEAVKAPGEAPETEVIWTYEEPLGVRRERRRQWLEQRDGALRLHEAGVRLAFGTGSGTPKELLEKIRQLVAAGLPREAALAGLTSSGAELLGVDERLGALVPGRDATFGLWSAHPLTEGAQLVELFVDGVEYSLDAEGDGEGDEPAAGVEVGGVWSIAFEGDEVRPATMTLAMDAQGVVTGRFETTSPVDDSSVEIDLSGRLAGDRLTLRGVRVGPNFQVEMVLEGAIDGDTLTGETAWTYSAGEQRAAFRATRAPR